jgi:predicted DNA-binding transcriptional regulator AlpA
MANLINPEDHRIPPSHTEQSASVSLNSLLTERDVASILNISLATVRRRRLLRQPPAPTKIGNSVRYKKDEISRFIEENTSNVHSGGRSDS